MGNAYITVKAPENMCLADYNKLDDLFSELNLEVCFEGEIVEEIAGIIQQGGKGVVAKIRSIIYEQ